MNDITKSLFMQTIMIGGLLIAASGPASGKAIINPRVDTEVMYDSNYWLSEEQEVGVVTYLLRPGVTLGFETAKTRLGLDANVNAFWYDSQDASPPGVRDAGEDDYIGFDGALNANHQLTDRLNLDLTDRLFVTRDPAVSDVNSNSTDRNKYTINYFEPGAYYELVDKFGLRTRYRNTFTNYEKDLEDSTENRGIFDLYYNLNRSSAVFVDYQVWERDYSQDTVDYTSNQLSLNYEKKFRYFEVTGGAGYHHREFDSPSFANIDKLSWKIEVAGKDPDTSRDAARSWMALSVGQELNDDGTGNNYFNATFVRFNGCYRFYPKLEGLLTSEYQNSDYENTSRQDDTYYVVTGVKYHPLDYLAIGIRGGVKNRDSNEDGRDYDDAFVAATLDLNYDFGGR